MKWIGISGSWRKTNKEIEDKLRNIIREIIKRGDGIVSGGALGVDSIALDEALKHDPKAKRIKILLPTTLEKYCAHYRKHAKMGTIIKDQAENLIKQLTNLKKINPGALVEDSNANFTEETKKQMYYKRNSDIVAASDELVAFQVKTDKSAGEGTADTVAKARTKGLPVKLFKFDLTKN